jgi:anti-sigma regulatory factor (Ser/Thr protein kinase)
MPAPRAPALATSITYPGTTEHIRTVRADLRAVLHECPMADDVILCASELAANAATHSRSRLPGGTFTVRAKISPGDYAWIEVEDDGGPTSPGIRDATGIMGSISSARSLPAGASAAITPPAPSGQDSTGPAVHSRDKTAVSCRLCLAVLCRPAPLPRLT